METITVGEYSAAVFRCENAEERPVIYIHTAAEECAEIFAASEQLATLVCVSGIDWNHDMSPWAAKRAFKSGEDFAGGAGEYLAKLTNDIIPAVEKHLGFAPAKRGIAGYSLGGLFALWSIFNTDLFCLAASASGSLWFDGWAEYMAANEPKRAQERVYISVGDKEKNARDQRMRTVEDNSRITAQRLGAKFELNEGNHFKDAPLRMARAIDHISGVIKMKAEKTVETLKKNGFKVSYFETKEEAADYLLAEIKGKTVGIGGSKTVEALNIYDKLMENNTVYWHWFQQPQDEVRRKASEAQVYLTSANGIGETGEIVNIDGNGNRVASNLYGHEKLFIIAGVNKIAPDGAAALFRARNVASPLNARRLGMKTPCATGELKCHDCNSPQRICGGVSTILRPMRGIGETEVVLINEELGY